MIKWLKNLLDSLKWFFFVEDEDGPHLTGKDAKYAGLVAANEKECFSEKPCRLCGGKQTVKRSHFMTISDDYVCTECGNVDLVCVGEWEWNEELGCGENVMYDGARQPW